MSSPQKNLADTDKKYYMFDVNERIRLILKQKLAYFDLGGA